MKILLDTDSVIDTAIDRRVAASNLADGGALTSLEYVEAHLLGLLNGWVRDDKQTEAYLITDAFVKGDSSKQDAIKSAAGLLP